jgi:catechol 2,3-dioxygenase-like lactoylglutathione lyase family enzyme
MERPAIQQQVTFLHSEDLEETRVFYENVLGLSLVLDQGLCLIFRTTADAYLGFCQHLQGAEFLSGVIVTLVTDEVETWYGYLEQQGLLIDKPPEYNEKFNIFHFFLRDPNGYLIEIQRFLSPEWPPDSS